MEREMRRREEALDRYWDAVVSGSEQDASLDASESSAELIRQLHSLGATPGMEQARERIWEQLTGRSKRDLEDMAVDTTGIAPSVLPTIGLNGRVDPRPGPGGSQGPQVVPARRWLMMQLATAALLLLTLVAGLVSFGPWRPGFPFPSRGHQLAAIVVATPEPGQFEFQWKFRGEPDPISQPYGLGIDPEGNVWVAEGGKDRFQVIAPDGTYRETWGTPGSGEGELEFLSSASLYGRPYGDIAFDAEGNIYIADTGNFRVQQFAPDRTFVRAWGSKGSEDGQFLAPSGIAIGADGVVYVSDETRSDVQMFAPDGQYLATIGEKGTADGQFSVPGGVTVDAAGDVWVADWSGRRIQRFTSSGDWVDTWENSGPDDEGGLRNPNDVVVDDRGRVFVVSDFNSRLHAFSVDGRFLATIGGSGSDPGEFSDPLGIALGKDGTVYVSDLNGIQAFRFVQP
jgi:DNA-binding beta-propeller fold protein YncE